MPSNFLRHFICLILFCFLCSSLHANIADHLKKAVGKSSNHKMRNIDFIYMINLDRRPEKFASAAKQLDSYDIYPYRFSAIAGSQLSYETINDVGVKFVPGMTRLFGTTYPIEAEGAMSHEMMEPGKTYFSYMMSKGALGCVLSHISVLKDAWDSGYETIWVMEDDIEVMQDPRLLSELIDRLDAITNRDWDVLCTDQDTRIGINQYVPAFGMAKRPDIDCRVESRFSEKYTAKYDINADFKKITSRFGAYSMIIRRSGIKKLLDFFFAHNIYNPYDIDNYAPVDLKRYGLRYDVVAHMVNAISDNLYPD